MKNKPAILVLEDGTIYHGVSLGAEGLSVGELVFNTAMTGYQEMLTDPSYAHQLITLTTAHIGNTGCNLEDGESSKIWASGLVIKNFSPVPSNYRSTIPLSLWLEKQGIVAIADVDTREITLKLREHGAMIACVTTHIHDLDKAKKAIASFDGLENKDLASVVSRQTIERWHEGQGEWAPQTKPQQHHVVVYDFGVKNNMLRILHDLGCHLTIVPATTPAEDVLAMSPDGVLLSNGPGDPKACDYAIRNIEQLLEANIPILGICLGFQMMALACGAVSLKMKFGHHGANHPVIETNGLNRVMITSQNHGFAIDEDSLPAFLEVTHRSLFDNSLQGIKHRDKKALGFQGHPEAGPGPHDMLPIFDQFIQLMH